MNHAIPDLYQLAADFEQRANGYSFPAEVWNVAADLADFSEPTSPSQLIKVTGQSLDQIQEALGRLLAEKLVSQNVMTWQEYSAARGRTSNDQETIASIAAAGRLASETIPQANQAVSSPLPPTISASAPVRVRPGMIAPPTRPTVPTTGPVPLPATSGVRLGTMAAPPAHPVNSESQQIAASPSPVVLPDRRIVHTSKPHVNPPQEVTGVRLGTIASQQSPTTATNVWILKKPDTEKIASYKPVIQPSQPYAETIGGKLLRPMLEQIENLKGGGVEGQLLVYQVFLRVPYQLLHDEGIKALHFVDERTIIQNPVLYNAIVKAAKDVAGIDVA